MRPEPDGSVRPAVRAGVNVTWLCIVALGALALHPDWLGSGRRAPFVVALAVAALIVVPLTHPRWRRRLSERFGERLLTGWAVADVVVIAAGIATTGDPAVAYVYLLPVVFFSSMLPTRVQIGLLTLIIGSYATVIGGGWVSPTVPQLGLWATTVVATAWLVAFLSSELRGRAHQRELAEADARHRSKLLATVAEASDGIFSLDPHEVLERVVHAAASLGFETAVVVERDDAVDGFRATHSVGMPDRYVPAPHPMDSGLIGEVFSAPQTVLVERWDRDPRSLDGLLDEGVRTVLVTPVPLGDDVPAVLLAATRGSRDIGTEEIEAFELLAVHAGAALSNARRFSDQRRITERLQQIDQLKNRFVETASHELRTPVTIVKAALELLERHGESLDRSRRVDLVTRAATHADDLIVLIERLTRFRDLDVDAREPRVRPIELRPVVVAAMDLVDARCDRHVLSWHVSGEPVVRADPSLLRLVLDELIDNACSHTPEGTPVRVRCHLEDDHVVVSVFDGGPGLPDEVRCSLGDSFTRGIDTVPQRGLGLGLATVVRALFAHDTCLEVSDPPEGGSRLWFRLPLVDSGHRDATGDVTVIPDVTSSSRTD